MAAVHFTFRPLDHATWVEDGRAQYKSCQFKAPYSQTLRELEDELRRIGVRQAVIEADCDERMVRLDGQLRSDARMNTPRVRLSFTHPAVGPLQYPCDTFSSWQDNIRAIVKTLEAQRAMDRYGATRKNQQYSGWKQLPGGRVTTVGGELGGVPPQELMSLQEATQTIVEHAGIEPREQATARAHIARTFGVYRDMYRRAVKRVHPDVGGNQRDFEQVLRAKATLDRHHGVDA